MREANGQGMRHGFGGALGAALRAGLMTAVLAGMLGLMPAGGARAASRESLEAFLKVTGFDVALESIALSARDAPGMLGMEAEDFGYQWTLAADEVFAPEKMKDMALDMLGQTLDDDLLAHAVDFYATPLGLRLVEVENESHMIDDGETKTLAGEALLEEMRSEDPEREALLKRMNDAIDASGTSVRAVQMIQYRFLTAASNAGVLELKLDGEALMALLRENEAEMRASLTQSALVNSAYTYRDFSDAEIETYTEALEDERMSRVYELMNAIQWEVMANRFEVLAGKMAGMSRGEEL